MQDWNKLFQTNKKENALQFQRIHELLIIINEYVNDINNK
jgi:hypothetical protein